MALNTLPALQAFQQGMAWKQNQDQYAEQQRQIGIRKSADEAYAGVIKQSQDEWVNNGGQGTYKPNDSTMFKAAEARGLALAKGGDWKGYMENEAMVTKERVRARASALQQYEADGDPEQLMRKVYPTLFDGRSITATEKIQGAESAQGLPARPDALKVTFSDGTSETKPVTEIVAGLKKTLDGPAAFAEREVKANFLRTLAQIEAEKQTRINAEKAAENRQTRAEDHNYGYGLADLNNQAAEKRAKVSADATRDAARIRASASLDATDRRVAGSLAVAGVRASSGGGAGRAGASSTGVQSTKVDSDGFVIAVMRNGDTKRLMVDGKPVRSGEWSKRVDSMVKTLRDAPGNFNKSAAELRKAAEESIANTPEAAKPGLSSFSGTGGLPALSTFKK